MIKILIVCLMPFTKIPNTKVYFFLGFRDDNYMNTWLKKHNVDWYKKTEWTVFNWIKSNIAK